ncbi:MAG: hypothetical protein R2739_07370 [Chitinophagales bacterium]|nr:hypothetical protein [Bacteroidota bacterium]
MENNILRKRTTIFVIVLLLLVLVYLYSMNKMVLYNHSGKVIEQVTVDAEFKHFELNDVNQDAVLHFTVFAPFNKRIRVKVKQIDGIKTIHFKLNGFALGEQFNQVELKQDGNLEYGALGLE